MADPNRLQLNVRVVVNPRHYTLARLWCLYQGERGTPKQAGRVMRQLTVADLERLLTERRVVLP